MLPITTSPLALIHVILLASLVAVTTSSQAEPLLYCDGAGYYPSEYTCFNNTILCPTLFGEPSLPCSGACYSPSMYSCTTVGDGNSDKKLQLLPPQEAPFAVVVHSSSPDLHGRTVQACGRRFGIGKDARTCEWCYGDCSGYGNKTVLFGNGRLAAAVPGSQYWFIDDETSVVTFTEGGKANNPAEVAIAGHGVTVYKDGYFAYNSPPRTWKACPSNDKGDGLGGGQPPTWHIYAPTTKRSDCYEVKLVCESVGSAKDGVWKYE